MAVRVWQDAEIRFDCSDSQLQLRAGEFVIDYLPSVEDTKGNNGEMGRLYVTNLRIVWVSATQSRVNLSIGYKTISSVSTKKASSKLRGNTEALYLLTALNKTQFEFIFTSLMSDSPRLFSTVMSVRRAYETSKMYRELKLRCALLDNKELKLLPQEQLFNKLTGVWNLCSDQGNLGTLYISSVRVVWHSNINDNFSISLPYLQMKGIKLRESKFGVALVLETSDQTCDLSGSHSGKFVLGFRIDPPEKLKEVHQEIKSLHRVYSASPIFGLEHETEQQPGGAAPELVTQPDQGEEEEVLVSDNHQDTLAAYFADPHKPQDREPVFCPELGLAIESLPEGYSIKDLWEVA